MKTNVSEYDFRRAFESIRPDNFSYQGLGAMFEYLEDLSDDIGEEIELDVIAICCDFCEYSLDEIISEYDYLFPKEPRVELDYSVNVSAAFKRETNAWLLEFFGSDDEDPDIEEVAELLQDHTQVIPVNDDTLIIQAF